MKVLYITLAITLFGTVGGCVPRRQQQHSDAKPAVIEPIQINWSDPGSVVEGFFDAKKRGDWRKAYDCCDFQERLSAKEAKQIRAEWKNDAPTWPEKHRHSQWIIVDVTIKGDNALVLVAHIQRVGLAREDLKRTGFEELLKLYGDRWKITEFQVMPK